VKEHEKLVGKTNEELRALAPQATHQHKKGGLYKDMGIAIDTETNKTSVNSRGIPERAWLHVYPYQKKVMLRGIDEDHKFTGILS
jgi:hypothetical protein